MDKFGELIRAHRLVRDESTQSVAKKMHLTPGTFEQIESTGTTPVSERVILSLAKHYNISVVRLAILSVERNNRARKAARKYVRSRKRVKRAGELKKTSLV